ncbi:MAG TPA: IS4 family transposase [Dehalococcoidia bacterium]|nr:IS4 family transposase [Dehalococcoidia bacterium]
MIETQDPLFANLMEQLRYDLPTEPETRVVNLAGVAIGIFRSRSLQVGQVVARSPLEASWDALKKRVQGFLKNSGVQVEVYQFPLAQRILGRIVAGGRRVLLILDRTEGDAFNILYVSVGWRGRALPLLGQMLNPGASSFAEQREVLGTVAGWMPQGAQVILLGDREFGTGVLAQWALGQGWGLGLRLRAQEYVRREGAQGFQMLPALRPGERYFWPNVAFTQKHAVGGLHLAMYWDWGSQEPWYLLTPEPNWERACASYSKRFQIEEMFKDYKNDGRGFGLELTGLQHRERLARLLLALALVYIWLLLWGAYAVATGQNRLVDNLRRPMLSLFQTGFRLVNRLWDWGRLSQFQWHLAVLEYDK